ncbi:hypothetical protein BD309DRAFT_563425 [Dichomitus squalens]|nr:hypothetical protein BD309DRAFT_563425 [Dichomitus squalens]
MEIQSANVEPDSFFNSSLLFNTTLKLAQHFLGFPSRALARLRRLDDMAFEMQEAAQQTNSGSQGYRRHRNGSHGSGVTPLPGPWGFLTSGYFVGLFVMVSIHTPSVRRDGVCGGVSCDSIPNPSVCRPEQTQGVGRQ